MNKRCQCKAPPIISNRFLEPQLPCMWQIIGKVSETMDRSMPPNEVIEDSEMPQPKPVVQPTFNFLGTKL